LKQFIFQHKTKATKMMDQYKSKQKVMDINPPPGVTDKQVIPDINPPPGLCNELIMDIKPPPGALEVQEKKRIKRRRYNDRRRLNKTQTVPGDIMQEVTRDKIRSRINELANKRTGVSHKNSESLKNTLVGSNGKVNVNKLLDKMGVVDQRLKSKLIKMAQSGCLENSPEVQKYMQEMMA
jgi:hypothetical protein